MTKFFNKNLLNKPFPKMCDKISFHNGTSETLSSKVTEVFKVFNGGFQKYQPNEVFLSFNGGKDCTVLLDLLNSFFKLHCKNENIRVVYIRPSCPFEEMDEFVESCEKFYNIRIEKLQGKLKSVLKSLCEQDFELKAVIMGTRRSDPFCQNLNIFEPTDEGWPQLMRISPLLDWTCKDIWEYILCNKIPYCKLYDEGYTSIGDKTNTKKNPHLKVTDPSTGEVIYRPAYKLLDDSKERAGRC